MPRTGDPRRELRAADGPDPRRRRRRSAILVVAGVLVVALVVLGFSNTSPVAVEWLGFSFELPLIAVIGVSFVGGMIVDRIVAIWWSVRRRRKQQLRAALQELRRPGLPPDESEGR